MRPLIGISTHYHIFRNKFPKGTEASYVNKTYSDAVIKAGGIPILIPITDDSTILNDILQKLDGLLLSGGYDVNPNYYNESHHHLLGEVYSELDVSQFLLTKKALELNLSILGICRGLQVLNVSTGGSLFQDNTLKDSNAHNHSQNGNREDTSHSIEIIKGTKLSEVFNKDIMVNSMHHQSVNKLGDNMIISALSPDGVIEGIELNSKKFVVAVQWHPEDMLKKTNDMLPLFKEFVNSCNND